MVLSTSSTSNTTKLELFMTSNIHDDRLTLAEITLPEKVVMVLGITIIALHYYFIY